LIIETADLKAIGNDRLRRLATYASVLVSLVLIVAKLFAFLLTDSVAMLSSLLDSTLDLIGACVTVLGVASALRPPDRDHRYGHGKAEPLAAMAQSAFIIGSSVLLTYEAISRFYHPHELDHQELGYIVMALAIALGMVLVAFQHYVTNRTASMAIGADKLHYIGDLAVNFMVVAAFAVYQYTGWYWTDPLFAILVAAGLIYSARHIFMHALNVLMDSELPDEDREKIMSIVRAQPQTRGIHDLRTRTDGDRIFIEFHLELDENMTLKAAQKIDAAISSNLRSAFPNADIIVHQDPAGLAEVRLDEQIEVREALK
jgi:ferrous-iron efflux pump FieF